MADAAAADGLVTARELDARLAEIRRAVDVANDSAGVGSQVELRDYVEALLHEHQRALDMAAGERDKAATILAKALEARTEEGDKRLRDHIENQIEQIRAALLAADKLEIERTAVVSVASEMLHRRLEALWAIYQKETDGLATALDRRFDQAHRDLTDTVAGLRRELEAQSAAAKEAVAKAEAATEKRFAGVNEWRGQSADRERTQQEQTALLTSTYMPREVAEAAFADVRRALETLTEKVGKLV